MQYYVWFLVYKLYKNTSLILVSKEHVDDLNAIEVFG